MTTSTSTFTSFRWLHLLAVTALLCALVVSAREVAPSRGTGKVKQRPGPSRLPAASVQIDNSTSLDPYKDHNSLFKRQIIILLLPNYYQRQLGGVGGVPYPGMTQPGLFPGGVNPGYFGASPGIGNGGIFRTTGSASAGGALIPGRNFRKPANFMI